ncbi:xpsE [Symbiodinium microadriaticum]|nr:xpsE [Symbiodinium microadriaticum]
MAIAATTAITASNKTDADPGIQPVLASFDVFVSLVMIQIASYNVCLTCARGTFSRMTDQASVNDEGGKPSIKDRLIDGLRASSLIDDQGLNRAIAAADEAGRPLSAVVAQLGLVTDQDLLGQLQTASGWPLLTDFNAAVYAPPLKNSGLSIPYLERALAYPLIDEGDEGPVTVAIACPDDEQLLAGLRLALNGRDITPVLAPGRAIRDAFAALDKAKENPSKIAKAGDSAESDQGTVRYLRELDSDQPVIRYVNDLIGRAVALAASDIHIEPKHQGFSIRFRLDGKLALRPEFSDTPHGVSADKVLARIKVLAGLDLGERRLSQDGRFRTSAAGRPVDLRVSIMPTVHGEGAVLRVLDRENAPLDLSKLGFDEALRDQLATVLDRQQGMVLVTGPTGSGKTTTLYAALMRLLSPDVKIITVEDPVEYDLEGPSQIQVRPDIGLSFAHILRGVLRHDPDILMVGEIRDQETARIAIQAALTGHLVLASLHTNDAIGAVARLRDMGVEDYLISATLSAVLAQRLVQKKADAGGGRMALGELRRLHKVWLSKPKSGAVLPLPMTDLSPEQSGSAKPVMVRLDGRKGRALRKAKAVGVGSTDTKVKPAALARLIDDLSELVSAGLRLDEALHHLAQDQSRNDPGARQLATALHDQVLTGGSLADGFAREVGDSYPMAAALTRAGEQAGQLPTTLTALANYLQRAEEVRSELRGALTYPLVVLGVALLSLSVLFLFVVPGFEDIYARQADGVPLFAQVIFALSDGLRWGGIPVLLLLGFWGWRLRQTGGFLRLPIPWLKNSLQAIDAERFARALGLLVSHGVAVDEAIGLAADGVGDPALRTDLASLADDVRRGQKLSSALEGRALPLPTLLPMLIRVGEQTGDLGGVALKAADLLHRESQRDIKEKLTLIEPALIIFTGVLVGAIVLGLMSVIVGLNRAQDEAGFGLIETLTALALAGLVAGGAMIWAIQGQQDQAMAGQRLQALDLAESLIDEAPAKVGEDEGQIAGMVWRRSVSLDDAVSGPLVDAFDINVTVNPVGDQTQWQVILTGETGFTLMELLVGLALTGLVVGFLAAGLSLLVDFRAHNSAEHEAIVQQEQLSRLLRHDLQLIGKGRGISPMTGTPNHLRFTTPGGLNRSAQAVSLRIDGGGLRLSSADLHLPHVKGRLSYFGVAHLGAAFTARHPPPPDGGCAMTRATAYMRDERGAALIITLWFVGAISFAAALLFVTGASDQQLVGARDHQTRQDLATEAALLKGLSRFTNQAADWPLTEDGSRHGVADIDGLAFQIRIRDEAGKVDLNMADEAMLRTAGLAAGLERPVADRFARLVTRHRQGNGPFKAVSELQSISAADQAALLPYVTVHGLNRKIDGLMAPEDLIRNMPWVSKGDARAFLRYRADYVTAKAKGRRVFVPPPPQRLARQFERLFGLVDRQLLLRPPKGADGVWRYADRRGDDLKDLPQDDVPSVQQFDQLVLDLSGPHAMSKKLTVDEGQDELDVSALITRETPFSEDQVLWALDVGEGGAVHLVLSPRETVAGFTADVRQQTGKQPDQIEAYGVTLSDDQPAQAFPLQWAAGLVLMVGVIFAGLMAAPMKLSAKVEALDHQLVDLRAEASAVNKAIAATEPMVGADILRALNTTPRMSAVLLELTNRLPDDASLTFLSLRGNQVELEGKAQSATRLVALLEASPMIEAVRFRDSVTRDKTLQDDRFAFSLTLVAPTSGEAEATMQDDLRALADAYNIDIDYMKSVPLRPLAASGEGNGEVSRLSIRLVGRASSTSLLSLLRDIERSEPATLLEDLYVRRMGGSRATRRPPRDEAQRNRAARAGEVRPGRRSLSEDQGTSLIEAKVSKRIWRSSLVVAMVGILAACADQPARVGTGDTAKQATGDNRRANPPIKPVQVPVTLDHHRQNSAIGAGQSGSDPDRRAFAELYDARDRTSADQVFGEEETGPIETIGGGEVAVDPQPRNVVLNFSDADIRDVVRLVLGDVRQENYLIDANVKGRVSVETRKPLTRDGALSVLENLVRASGNSLSKKGSIWVVAPAGRASGGSIDLASENAAGQGFQVYPLTFVGAQEMAGILTKVLPQGSVAHVDTSRNLVMVRGDGSVFDLTRDTVEIFDVDAMKDQSVLLRGLTHVDAGTMAFELDNLYGGTNKGPLAGIVRIVPIERLNAVMVMSPQRKYLEDAHQWITRLDRSRDPTGRRLFVYYVQNGKASSLASTLQGLFPTAATGGSVVTGSGSAPPATAESGAEGATPPSTFARAVGQGAFSSAAAGLRVMADEVNNALLILATPQEYEVMAEVLRKLDIAPLQVLIEATIIEVALQDDLRFGVQYFLNTGGANLTDSGRTVLTNRMVEAITPTLPGFAFTLADGFQPRFILEALSEVTDVKVISSPQVMVLDNQSAELQVGDQVPIITQSSQGVFTNTSPIVNSVEYRDTGVTLQVTPRVNSSGLVTLEISQEVSDVAQTTTSTINSPTIRQRRILSTVAVHSGDTVTLGGLIRETEQKGQAGLPGFSQIP